MAKLYTMQDIADAAGVSKSTVSRALKGHSSIPPKTRERVLSVARSFGYHTHPMVSALMASLRSSHPPNEPVVVAYLTFSSSWRDKAVLSLMHEGASERALEFGFKLEEIRYAAIGNNSQRLNQILSYRRIQGILLGAPLNQKQVIELDWDSFSAITLGAVMPNRMLSCVRHNHFQGSSLAYKTLIDRGYRRIAFFTTKGMDNQVQGRWVAGYLYCQQHLPPSQRPAPLVWEGERDTAAFKAHFINWVRETGADALILTTSDNGIELEWLLQAGFSIPDEFGLAVLSHKPSASKLAGIHQRPKSVGAAAMDLLSTMILHNIKCRDATFQEVSLDGDWIDGSSVRTAKP